MSDFGNALIKGLGTFLARDVAYMIGGSHVILSFFYLVGKLELVTRDVPTAIYFVLAGTAYVIGILAQDTSSWVGLVTTAKIEDPGDIWQWFYKRFMRADWKKRQKKNVEDESRESEWTMVYQPLMMERMFSQVILTATMASCSMLSALLMAIGAIVRESWGACIMAAIAFGISILFVILNRIKVLQCYG